MVAAKTLGHPARVDVDGPSAAGKTTLADALSDPLVGQTIKYVHVASASQVAEGLPATAQVLQDVRTVREPANSREWAGASRSSGRAAAGGGSPTHPPACTSPAR